MKRYNGKFMFGFKGKNVPSFAQEMIVRRRIGGFVLFSKNIDSKDQLSGLCGELQKMRAGVSDFPLFIAVDQEGGPVNRVVDGATMFPSAMAIAATGNVEYARRVGECMASQLLSLGINMNFAPCLDICANRENTVIGVRSFGDDPEKVGLFGAAMITGMQKTGLLAIAKHFPGLGYTSRDPHLEMPVIPKEISELEREDLVPFKHAIAADVAGIMVGHAHYPSVSQRPASLSERVMIGLLRERLGFQGISITDDLGMESISSRRNVGDAVVKACKAGADIFLVCHSGGQQIGALTDFSVAIKGGRLRSGHLKGGLRRIRAIKERMRERATTLITEPAEDGEALAAEVAAAALTLVSNGTGVLPLRIGPEQRILVLLPEWDSLSEVEQSEEYPDALVEHIRARHGAIDLKFFDVNPGHRTFTDLQKSIGSAGVVIMGTCDAYRYEEQQRLVNEVAAAGKPTVFIALRNPFDAEIFPEGAATLVTYGSNHSMMAAANKALFGEIKPAGSLPVSLKL